MDARLRGVQRGSGSAARAGVRSGSPALHPVLALQRAVGNRAVVSRMPVQRKAPGTAKAQALTRLKTEFGITAVREGTVADQAQRVAGVPSHLSADEAQKQLAAGGWTAWSPPEKSGDWTAMVDGVPGSRRPAATKRPRVPFRNTSREPAEKLAPTSGRGVSR